MTGQLPILGQGITRRWGAALILFALQAGCGGEDSLVAAGGRATGGDTATIACALTGCEIAKLPPTAAMPSGSATYDGRASVTTTTALGALVTTNADLALTANFTARTVGITFSAIQTGSTVFAGTATGAGTISSNTFSATYNGPISGSMAGTFRGTAAAALNGEMTITNGGATGGDAYGQFFANKQ